MLDWNFERSVRGRCGSESIRSIVSIALGVALDVDMILVIISRRDWFHSVVAFEGLESDNSILVLRRMSHWQ